MAAPKTAYKKYVSDMTIGVGPIVTKGALVKIEKTDKSNQVSVCPDCTTEPIKPRQTYVCDSGHDHPMGELAKAITVNGELKFVDKEQIVEAKKSTLPINVLKTTVHNADDVWTQTYAGGGNSYVFIPDSADEYHSTLVELVRDTTKAFVGMCNLRNHEGFFQLRVWRDQLVVQKIAWPDEIDAIAPEAPLVIDNDVLDMAKQFVDAIQTNFDTANYKSNIKDAVAAVHAAAAGNGVTPVPPKPKPQTQSKNELLALLGSALGK